MKVTEHVYQISGVPFGTNSNGYVIQGDGELIMIDAGFTEYQFEIMKKAMVFWGLHEPVTHSFITHAHFDHAGNAHLLKKEGVKLYAGFEDAEAIESGDERTIGHMFGKTFTPCQVDQIVKDQDQFHIAGIDITAIHVPGHSAGSMMYEVHIDDKTLLFTGDFAAIEPAAPEDDVSVQLAWQGAPDYNRDHFMNSITRMRNKKVDIICPGHYYVYYGDSQDIFEKIYQQALKEL